MREACLRKPEWLEFAAKYAANPQDAFEALCRYVFKARYGKMDNLPYFHNHKGVETAPIEVEGKMVGFQAKYFDKTIKAAPIIKSMREAAEEYPKLRYIIYTNKVFGKPRKGDIPDAQRTVETEAQRLGYEIEWVFGNNIIDVVEQSPLLYHLFFNNQSHLMYIHDDVQEINKIRFDDIYTDVVVRGECMHIERKELFEQLHAHLSEGHHVVISGEGGCGKSALVKQLYERYMEDNNTSFYILNAGQLGAAGVNDYFRLSREYQLPEFVDFYKGCKQKVLIIDSAEKMIEMEDRSTSKLLLYSMQEHGWSFVFTVRQSYTGRLRDLLQSEYNVHPVEIELSLLGDQELDGFLSSNHLPKPADKKMYDRIHNLFYLARYCEVVSDQTISLQAFRERVWNIKFRGEGKERLANQEAREQCMFEISRRLIKDGGFYVNKSGFIDYESVARLIHEDILRADAKYGYYFSHDLYTEWSVCKYIDGIWNENPEVNTFFTKIGDSISAQNYFRKWLAEQIETNVEGIQAIIESVFDERLSDMWRSAILSEILRSKEYAKVFFLHYLHTLNANEHRWAIEVLKLLPVTCMNQHIITLSDKDYPIMQPCGSGWDCAVSYVCDHYDALIEKHGKIISNLLDNYAWSREGDESVLHWAGLLTLKPHQSVAESRKKGIDVYFGNIETASRLAVAFLGYIDEEITAIVKEVLDNKWNDYNDPYYELMHYIVKAQDFHLTSFYIIHPQETLALMDLFWSASEGEYKDTEHIMGRLIDDEEMWGLSQERLSGLYFPVSGMHTCIGIMLRYCPVETIDFLIRFVDKHTRFYAQYIRELGYVNQIRTMEMELLDGTKKKVLGNQETWCIYRGFAVGHNPSLMQCIHMALENYLLEETRQKHTKKVKLILDLILTRTASVSLLAVVASIVLANPDDYMEEGLVLSSHLFFIQYDKLRAIHEGIHYTVEFGYNRVPHMLEERKKSDALPHRNDNLEEMLFQIQNAYADTTEEAYVKYVQRAYHNVDLLKQQLEQVPENEKLECKFIISNTDLRSMQKRQIEVQGQTKDYWEPYYDEEQKEVLVRNNKEKAERAVGENLKMWVIYHIQGKKDMYSRYVYEKAPLRTLADCKKLKEQLSNPECGLYPTRMEDEIPSAVCALVLIMFADQLREEDFDYCAQEVINALQDVDTVLEYNIFSFKLSMSAVPQIFKEQKYADKCAEILGTYAAIKKEVDNARCCDSVAMVVEDGKLWDINPKQMNRALERLMHEELKIENVSCISCEGAESVLCLLSTYPKNAKIRRYTDVCMEVISHMWDKNDERKNLYTGMRNSAAYVVARVVLSADRNKIPTLLSYFKRYINTNKHDSFLMEFILRAMVTNDYERFWLVWYELFDTIIKGHEHYPSDEVLSVYMLNPKKIRDWGNNWFKIEERDIEFFNAIAQEIGEEPIVLNNIVNLAITIAMPYVIQILSIIDTIVTKSPEMDMHYLHDDMLYMMEKYTRIIYDVHLEAIRRNRPMHDKYVRVLNFMMKHGSSYASTVLSEM